MTLFRNAAAALRCRGIARLDKPAGRPGAGRLLVAAMIGIGLQLPAQAQLRGGASSGCDWSEAAVLPAYPETHARYYTATLPTNPPANSRIRIEGLYPDTRYFSYQIYDGAYSPIDGLPDYLLLPDAGSESTFSSRTAGNPAVAPGGRYTAYIQYGPIQANRPPNTLFTDAERSSLRTTRVVLRSYLEDATVLLPKIVLETPDGDQRLGTSLSSSECGSAAAPSAGLSGLPFNIAFPGLPASQPSPFQTGLGALNSNRNIRFDVYYGTTRAGDDFGLNQDTAFMAATLKNLGDVILIRGRAPSFRERTASTPTDPDVRYWSMCQNDKATTLVIACAADRETRIDADGFFNLIVANPGTVRLPASSAFTELPFGASSNGYLIYRQLLSRQDFAGSAARIPVGVAPESVIGDYTPKGVYCSAARFNASINAGDSPAAVFAACLQQK